MRNVESPQQDRTDAHSGPESFDPARDRHPDPVQRSRIVGQAHRDFMAGKIDVERLLAIREANGVDYMSAFTALARVQRQAALRRYREQHPVKSRVLRWLGMEGWVL